METFMGINDLLKFYSKTNQAALNHDAKLAESKKLSQEQYDARIKAMAESGQSVEEFSKNNKL